MPSDVRFADIRKQLEQHGWQLVRIAGSHHIFKGEGRPIFSIPVHKGRVKAFYAREVERAIEALRSHGAED